MIRKKSITNLFDGVNLARLDVPISETVTQIYVGCARLSAQRLYNLGDPWLQSLLLEEFPDLIPQEVKDQMEVIQLVLPLGGESSLASRPATR